MNYIELFFVNAAIILATISCQSFDKTRVVDGKNIHKGLDERDKIICKSDTSYIKPIKAKLNIQEYTYVEEKKRKIVFRMIDLVCITPETWRRKCPEDYPIIKEISEKMIDNYPEFFYLLVRSPYYQEAKSYQMEKMTKPRTQYKIIAEKSREKFTILYKRYQYKYYETGEMLWYLDGLLDNSNGYSPMIDMIGDLRKNNESE